MGGVLTATVLACCAGIGVFLLATPHRRGREPHPPRNRRSRRSADWMTRAGLSGMPLAEFLAIVVFLATCAGMLAYAFFGGALSALVIAAFASTWPLASFRRRAQHRREVAMEAWPRLIEEIRILTSSAGRSIPQALFDAGRRAPTELRAAFVDAHRQWLLTTDFARTLEVLKRELADPSVDATCETLLVAHSVGGADLDRRLEALAEDRRQDVAGRKDARAKQAGVRFARSFVLVVPMGMALAGTSVGTGRAAYATTLGQALVVTALVMVAVCWWWAGLLLRLPESDRVFGS